jgi:hypothetical protein
MASHLEHVSVCKVAAGLAEPPPTSALQESGHGQTSGACIGVYSGGWAF